MLFNQNLFGRAEIHKIAAYKPESAGNRRAHEGSEGSDTAAKQKRHKNGYYMEDGQEPQLRICD